MKLFSALLSLFGLGGGKTISLLERGAPYGPRAPYIAPETRVYRGGRHSQIAIECPACFHYTSKRGLCRNRMCWRFNAATTRTHPHLLSLDRGTRLSAQARWERGGMAALWAA